MKTINKLFIGCSLVGLGLLSSCSDFDDINKDPSKTGIESTMPEYFLNKSIGKIQMDPSTGERVYVYNWNDAARNMGERGHLSVGLYNDDYISSFYYPCIAEAITNASLAIDLAGQRKGSSGFNDNLREFGRIWRAYLISQFADSFGPYPLNASTGDNPTFNTVKETYEYILAELKEAVNSIDKSVTPTEEQAKCDPGFAYNASKWVKFGNSLRMRLAMRLSNTDLKSLAQSEFEDACKDSDFIKNSDDILSYASNDGWNDYTGPFTRGWNLQLLSSTMCNILTNLGGIAVTEQRSDLAEYVKPSNYLGIKYDKHFVENTDNPTKQYWLDGMPTNLDPRALKMYSLVGDVNATNTPTNKGTKVEIGKTGLISGNDTIKINGTCCWNGFPVGTKTTWSPGIENNELISTSSGRISNYPILGKEYCTGAETGLGRVVYFGPWESYFLLAEAALYGWNTSISSEDAYEKGIRASFDYFGVSQYADDYINSEDYNMVGTSVKFTHTTEPTTVKMQYKDGYNMSAGLIDINYEYPEASKTLYGKALNDQLTKIITQKYIAQLPYLALECWSDYRRLGLPFFDMPANTTIMTGSDMTEWRPDSYKSGQSWKYYPQRMRYPLSLRTSDPDAYDHALELLGGDNTTMVPLWWAKTDK